MGSTLDYSKFKSVFVDIFSQDTSLNGVLWADRWGNASQYTFDSNGLTLTSTAASGWATVGFMQAPTGKSAGEGYGLYQFTGYANAGQGTGIAFLMWRADNLALDPSEPNVATEVDLLETWDGTKTGESTIHYYNAGWSGGNGQEWNALPQSIDLTKVHTYAMDWERGSLTYYVDGVEVFQDTTHAPLDYADGGSNEVMGAELVNMTTVVKTSTVQLHITEMEYSAPVSTSSLPATTASTGPVTLTGGQNYVAAAGAVVQASNGSNTVTAASGNVSVTGGSGSLSFVGGSGPSTVSGGTGSLTVQSGSGGGVYTGGSAGHNWLVSQGASGSNTTLTGGGAGDALFGSASGNALLSAGPGRDTILGGGGQTTIVGGSAAGSIVFTGSGPTSMFGGVAGGDIVVGGSGSLNVTAQKGDAIFGGGGALSVSGSTSGGDSIVGGTGTLSVTGRGGNMLVVSGTSTSTIQTGNGASLIFAQSGSTNLFGGTGWMEVVMGAGKLTVAENGGPTTYVVSKGSAGGTDVLNGFRPGTDQIDLYGYSASEQSQSLSSGSTFLNLSDGTKIELVGVTNPGSSIVG